MRLCVYQGITTLINSTYEIGVMHKVVATNFKQTVVILTSSYDNGSDMTNGQDK
jgi:hypothetical protein